MIDSREGAMANIRELSDEYYPQIIRITSEAYPSMGVISEDDRAKQVERFRFARSDRRWVPYGYFRDGQLAGVFRRFDFVLNVRDRLLPAGGLGMVAVDLPHKKERVAKEMVEFFHDYYDHREVAMTTLWPFRVDFYHDMGYGLGGKIHEYVLSPTDLPRGPSKAHVRLLTVDDVPAINDCQNRMFRKRTGMIESSEDYLKIRMKHAQGDRFYGCEIDGRLDGYMICRWRKPEHPSSFMDYDLTVWELIYHSSEALSELLTFLYTQLDQVGRIYIQVADEEFYMLPRNPTLRTGRQLAPTFHDSHTCAVGTMYRVVNARRLWTQLAECDFNGMSLTVRINLRDRFHPANDGPLAVRFDQGRPVVVENGKVDVEVDLDAAEFSSMIMGAVSFRSLLTYGLATISDPGRIEDINRLFSYPQRPICYTGF